MPAGDLPPEIDAGAPTGGDDLSSVVEPSSAPVDTGPADPSTAEEWDDRWTGDQGKAYLQRLRAETKTYRERYAPWEKATTGLVDTDAAVIREFAAAIASGDDGRARELAKTFYDVLHGSDAAEASAPAAAETGDEDRPLTMKDLQDFFDKQRQTEQAKQVEQAQREALAEINSIAGELGYNPSKDAVTHRFLLTQAQVILEREPLPIREALMKADAEIKSMRQKAIDEYVAPKVADATRTPTPAQTGSTPAADRTPKNVDEANSRLSERFRAAS